jgi:hypothetical protein
MEKEEKKVYVKPSIVAFERMEGQQAILAISKAIPGTLQKQYIDEDVASDKTQTTDPNHGFDSSNNSYFGF